MNVAVPAETTNLDNVILISLDNHVWSGRKKLKPEDLGKAVADLPPEELASLGSKKIFDRQRLAVFNSLHRAAVRACVSVGIRFLGGFAIPEQDAPAVIQELDRIKAEYQMQRTKFIQEYDDVIQEMLQNYPTWNHMLRNSIMTVEQAASRISWDWDALKVVSSGIDLADEKMAEKAQGMAGQLFFEVSKEGQELTKTLLGKEKVRRNILITVRNIRKKLSGLSFLDSRVGPIIQQIDTVLAAMPTDAPIEGNDITTLFGLAWLLSDPDRMKTHGERILNGEMPEQFESKPDVAETEGVSEETQHSEIVKQDEPEEAEIPQALVEVEGHNLSLLDDLQEPVFETQKPAANDPQQPLPEAACWF